MKIESDQLNSVSNILQLVVLIIAIAAIFLNLGSKDQQLTHANEDIAELKAISSDLVKAGVQSQAKDGEHDRMLTDITRRLEILELK